MGNDYGTELASTVMFPGALMKMESVPFSANTFTFKTACQNPAATRIKCMSQDSSCNKVKEFLTAPSKEILFCY